MKLVAYAFAAATFIGASCPNPAPAPPPDVVTDSSTPPSPPDCRCKPCPAADASCPLVVDAAVLDATPLPSIDAAPPPPAPAPKPTCVTACARMKAIGCKEGSVSDCASKLCAVNVDPRFVHYDVACLTNAATPAAVAACGMNCTQ